MCFCPPGREWSDWSSELRIPGDELKWKFISDGSVNGWGWRFTVYPIMPAAGEEEAYGHQGLMTHARETHMSCSFSTLWSTFSCGVGRQHCPRPRHGKDQNCSELLQLSACWALAFHPHPKFPSCCWLQFLSHLIFQVKCQCTERSYVRDSGSTPGAPLTVASRGMGPTHCWLNLSKSPYGVALALSSKGTFIVLFFQALKTSFLIAVSSPVRPWT